MQENAFILLSFFFIESKLRIVILIEMTNVIVLIANQIQKPPGGTGLVGGG